MRLPAVQAKVFSTSSVTVGPARSIASSVFLAYDEPDRACPNASTIYRGSNPVRVIDVFVEWIDLAEMGFAGIELAAKRCASVARPSNIWYAQGPAWERRTFSPKRFQK